LKAKTQVLPAVPDTSAGVTLGQRLRVIAAQRAEDILAEIAPTLRHVRMFILMLTISIPLFMAGLVAALWHLAH
jgi:hypothetical protein